MRRTFSNLILRISVSVTLLLAVVIVLLAAVLPRASSSTQPVRKSVIQAVGESNPYIKLQEGRDLEVESGMSGSTPVLSAMRAGGLKPLALASGDVNRDGYPDLVCGYGAAAGGVLTVYRGDPQAFAPSDPEILRGIRKGQFPDPFLKEPHGYELPAAADFIGAGDFNRDGKLDIVVASRGGNTLYLLEGHDDGEFSSPQRIRLRGAVTAMVTGGINNQDGLTDLILGIDSPSGSELLVYEGMRSILETEPEAYSLPARASSLALGRLDDDPFQDLALLVHGQVLILHGHDNSGRSDSMASKKAGKLETVDSPFTVKAMALGEFIWDRDSRTEIAMLADDGAIHIVTRGTLDTRPWTQQEVFRKRLDMQRMVEKADKHRKNEGPAMPSALSQSAESVDWVMAEDPPAPATDSSLVTTSASDGASSQPILLSARISSLPSDDLLVMNAAKHRLQVLYKTEVKEGDAQLAAKSAGRPSVSLESDDDMTAVLPMRLNVDGRPGLVVMSKGKSAPTVFLPMAGATFTVTRADDPAPNGCVAGDCSLREAIIAANADVGADTIVFNAGINPTLTIVSGGGHEDAAATGDLDINSNVTITGNAQTVISTGYTSTCGDCKVFGVNQTGAFNGLAVSFTGVTIQNGFNDGTNFSGTFFETGGGIDFFLTGSGNASSMSNCVVTNNRTQNGARSHGGGINVDGFNTATPGGPSGGTISFTSCTISNNTATADGGGGMFLAADKHDATLTNCVVTGNNQTGASGGGMQITHSFGGTVTVTGASGSVSSNTASTSGGGIVVTFNQVTNISNITINNNTATGSGGSSLGGGVLIDTLGATGVTGSTTLTSVTISNNHANNGTNAAAGGVRYGGFYAATMTGCTVSGNTSKNGAGVANTGSTQTPTPTFAISGGSFTGNAATGDGGAFVSTGTGSPTASVTTFSNVTIGGTGVGQPNTAANGGGIADTQTGSVTVTGGTVTGNSATTNGGGVFISGGAFTLSGVTVDSNTGGTGDGLHQSAGTFAGANTLNFNGGDSISLSGGTFTSTPGTLNLTGNLLNSGGVFANNGGLVNFQGSSAQSIGGTTAMTFNNLTINNSSGVSLGASETVAGTLTLSSGVLGVLTNTLTLNGTVSFTSGSITSNATGTVNYNKSTNVQNIAPGNYGNLTFSNFTKILPSGVTIKIAGAFTTGAAGGHTFTGSTVEFNGTSAQTLPSNFATYNNLTLNNTVGVTGFAGLTVQGLLRVQAGAFTSSSTYKDVQIDNLATLAGTNATTINISGSWTNNGTFTANGNTVNFNGSSLQTIGGSSSTTFNNLTINNAAGVNLGNNATVGGALTLTAGALGVGTNTLTLNGAVSATVGSLTSGSTGTINYNQGSNGQATVLAANYGNLTFSNFNKTLAGSGTIGIAGTFTPGSATGHTITGSTIDFNGSGGQTIPAFNYNNLASSNAGARTLASSGSIRIAGLFTPGANTYTITGSTIEYNGSSSQTLPSGFITYNNLTLNNTAGTTGFSGLTVQGLLRVQAGTFTSSSTYKDVQIDSGATLAAAAGSTINVSGNWTNNGTFTPNDGTVNFNGGSTQTFSGSSTTAFNNLTINNASGATLNADITINATLTLTAGALAIGSRTLTLNNALTITGGSFTSNANGTVNYNQLSNGQNVAPGSYGNLTFSNLTKTLPSSGTVKIAGTFTTGAAGGHTLTGSTIEFNGAVVQTIPSTFTTYNNLTLNNAAGVTGFSGLIVQGLLRIQQGTFTSSSTYNSVQIDSGATLSATAASTINIGGSWTNNGTFNANTGTVVFNGSSAQTISGTTTFNNLTINNASGVSLGASTNVTVGATLTLTSGTFAVGSNTLTLNGAAIATSGSLTSGTTGTVNYNQSSNGQAVLAANYGNLAFSDFTKTLASSGTLRIAGTFTTGAAGGHTVIGSTVEFNGAAAQNMPAGFNTYNNLTINNSAGVSLGASATVNGVLTLTAGDLNTGAFVLTMPVAATSAGTTDVVGNVKRTGFVTNGAALSFGNPFNSIKINTGTTTAPTDINVNLEKAVPTTPAPFASAIARKYTITPTGGTGISATLRLHYLDTELNGNTEGATLNLFRYDGANWHKEGQTANDTANNWVEKNNVTQFSPWTMNSSVPTEARLESFTATGYDGGTLIEWRTGFEADNLGFNLYRDEGGKRVPVNQQMVAGSALVAGSGVTMHAGQSYAWWDGAASKSGAQYWLESVDLNGHSELHGPFSSKYVGGDGPARGNSSMLGRTENAQAGLTLPVEGAALPQSMKPEQIALQAGLAGQTAVKMWVKREGFYRVTATELAEAGFDPRADTRLLQLYADGQQVPINVTSDKDGLLSAIEFYGRGLDAAFTDQRVYWLVSGSEPGLRIKQVKGAGQPTASQSFLYTAERRDRTIYFSALRNGERENFFGAVIASSPVDQSLTLQHVDQSTIGTATIEVALQGVTTLRHKVWVYLNGSFAGEASFEGQTEAVSRFDIAQSLLRSGENQVRLIAQAGTADISLVDYISLSYWHSFTADDNALRLTTPGNQEVTIGGFTSDSIRVLDVTDPDSPQELGAKIEQQKTGFAVTVSSPAAGERRLLAIADDRPCKPSKMAANLPSGLRTPAHAADLVIIARREFFSAIEPLRSLRTKQGLKVELADIEDVFDEFSFGNKSPQAMKDFLLYATTSWKVKPRFVLLVGDASYDAKNYLGLGDSDLVPTKLIDTNLMETASDDWLSDFNSDGVADMAVGRLAARTPAEASLMVRKIIGYESSEPIESMLLVADTNNGFDFEVASAQLSALIPGNLRVEQINRGQVGDATAKSRLIDGITRGQKVVNYMGHGSVNLWSGSLLTNEDAGNLTNGERLPVFVMMTCLNGYFHDPSLDSLAESLLKAENGGAVAVWTSTGMTAPGDQSVLNKQLYQLLFTAGNTLTLGEATARAKTAVTDGDIRRTWVLLGDPTMRLK